MTPSFGKAALLLLLTTTAPLTTCFVVQQRPVVGPFGTTAPPSRRAGLTTSTRRHALPILESLESVGNSGFLLSDGDTGELAKTVIITLSIAGGLIPALFSANSAMLKTLFGKRSANQSNYLPSSGASGPLLPSSALLFPPDPIPTADVIAIIGRISTLDSVADWRNLPTTKLSGVNPENPPMWLPRATFKENVRAAKFLGWPSDPKTGEPAGGAELAKAELPRVRKKGAEIGDAALDAVFDTWAGGSAVATPDKVEAQLGKWRRNEGEFDLDGFVGAAVRGRAVTASAALTFVVIQVTVFGSLFVAPFLRVFLGVDIGLGPMGECPGGVCRALGDLF